MNEREGKDTQGDYYRWIKNLERSNPETLDPSELAELCVRNFNLNDELRGLPRRSVIYDVGCGTEGVAGLQDKLRMYQVIGIDPLLEKDSVMDMSRGVLIKGTSETLAKDAREQLEPRGFYSPRVILMRNVLQLSLKYLMENGERVKEEVLDRLYDAFSQIEEVLPTDGKALIYDANEGPSSYETYIHIIDNLGINLRGAVLPSVAPEDYPDASPSYLRLTKGEW